MAGLLRRLRRTKEVEPESEPAPTEEEVAGPPAAPERETDPEVSAPEESAAPPAEPTPRESPEVASGPPPPLPEADQDAARSSMARRRPQSKCFLCGTDLDGPWCPTCRMAWSD